MKLTNYNKTLIKYSEPFWSKMVSHKFCEEMGDGTIDKKLLNKYLLIEYSFVKLPILFESVSFTFRETFL